jgi:hypothetical protein
MKREEVNARVRKLEEAEGRIHTQIPTLNKVMIICHDFKLRGAQLIVCLGAGPYELAVQPHVLRAWAV